MVPWVVGGALLVGLHGPVVGNCALLGSSVPTAMAVSADRGARCLHLPLEATMGSKRSFATMTPVVRYIVRGWAAWEIVSGVGRRGCWGGGACRV